MSTRLVRIRKETYAQLKAWQHVLYEKVGVEKSLCLIIAEIVHGHFDRMIKRAEAAGELEGAKK